MKKKIGFVISAGHLDIEWYQPLRSYRFWTIQSLEDLKVAAARDDFGCYVLDGQVFPLEEYLEVVPEDTECMKQLIADKKLAVGPFYTQFDEWLPSAENMIRNCLYGRLFADSYGGYMRAGYLPDNFGHPLQLPQILNGFGIDSLMFMRGMPELPDGYPDEFLYQGIDGSKVLVSHFRETYTGAFDIFNKKIDPMQKRDVPYYEGYLSFEYHRELAVHDDPERIAKNLIANAKRIQERYPSGIIPLISGYDHLPPQINIGDSIKMASEMQEEIEFVMGSAEDYINKVYETTDDYLTYKEELIGSMYQYVLLGALSTRSYIKRQNFACEVLLERYAEPLIAIADMYGYKNKPRLMDESWKFMMINSAHDSIHGSSTDEVHLEMESRYAAVRQTATGVIHDALCHMENHVNHWWNKGDRGVLYYTPVTSDFAQPMEIWLPIGDKNVIMMDSGGNYLPTQIFPREKPEVNGKGELRNWYFPNQSYRKVLFMANAKEGEINSVTARIVDDEINKYVDKGMENEFIRIETKNGLINIVDKETGNTFYNLNLLVDEADAGDAWDFSPTWYPNGQILSSTQPVGSRIIEQGDLKTVLQVAGYMQIPSHLMNGEVRSIALVHVGVTFEITLYKGIKRVDVKLIFDNTVKDHRLRLSIPTGIGTDNIISQGQLAIIQRPIERTKENKKWLQPPTNLLPFREWTAVTDGKKGLAIAFKGVYDYEAEVSDYTGEVQLSFTLLRSFELMSRMNMPQRKGAAADSVPTPGAQCIGKHEIEWSYIPYTPAENDIAPFLPIAQSFLYPPVTHAVRNFIDTATDMVSVDPFYSCDTKNIVFSAFKKKLSGDGYILRMYENQGITGDVTIKLRDNFGGEVWIANMNEDAETQIDVVNNAVKVKFGAYKAITLLFIK